MDKQMVLGNYVTILVNSCDAYEDLWLPFFTLLNRYWDTSGIRIVLNAETKDFTFEGLKIDCVHPPVGSDYGSRMLYALSQIKTKYVVMLLDDFFIRSSVDNGQILQIINWMEADSHIVYFNCDKNNVYVDWEVDKYPGYRRLPPANDYILSMQAAIWRTDRLKKYWHAGVSPWEWELISNISTVRHRRDKFYCLTDYSSAFLNYGNAPAIWGVFRGKWYYDDVVPLFKKENIHIDFEQRGFYEPQKGDVIISYKSDRRSRYTHLIKHFGLIEVPRYFLFGVWCKILRFFDLPYNDDYYGYLRRTTQKRFLRKMEKVRK